MMTPFLDAGSGGILAAAVLVPLATAVLLLAALLAGRFVRWARWTAVAAVGVSWVLSLSGFAMFRAEQWERDRLEQDLAAATAKLSAGHGGHEGHGGHDHAGHDTPMPPEAKAGRRAVRAEIDGVTRKIAAVDEKRRGGLGWAWLTPVGVSDPHAAAALGLGYRVDHLTVVLFPVLTFLAGLVLVAAGPAGADTSPLVFPLSALVCSAALGVIIADNLFQAFVGLEVLGVCSSLALGLTPEGSGNRAGIRMALVQRAGTTAVLLGMAILWASVGTLSIEELCGRLRAPLVDSHQEAVPAGGRFLRADVVEQPGDEYFAVITPAGSEVVVFPRRLGHLHAADYREDHGLELALTRRARAALETGLTSNQAGGTGSLVSKADESDYATMPYRLLVTVGLLLFLGAATTTALAPFHVWLVDLADGPPTLVALIAGATAGLTGCSFLARCFPLLTPEVRLVVAWTGGLTVLLAAAAAAAQTDVRRSLALAAVGQFGSLALELAAGGWASGMTRMTLTAGTLVLLFLAAGGARAGQRFPVPAVTGLVGVLGVIGLQSFGLAPVLGFVTVRPENAPLFLLALAGVGLTAFALLRGWLTAVVPRPGDQRPAGDAPGSSRPAVLVVLALTVLAVTAPTGPGGPADAVAAQLRPARPGMVDIEFGVIPRPEDGRLVADPVAPAVSPVVRGHENRWLAGLLGAGAAAVGFCFAVSAYAFGGLDPAEAERRHPRLAGLARNNWCVGEALTALTAGPVWAAAEWCAGVERGFDRVLAAVGRGVVGIGVSMLGVERRVAGEVVGVLTGAVAGAAAVGPDPPRTTPGRVTRLVAAVVAVVVVVSWALSLGR